MSLRGEGKGETQRRCVGICCAWIDGRKLEIRLREGGGGEERRGWRRTEQEGRGVRECMEPSSSSFAHFLLDQQKDTVAEAAAEAAAKAIPIELNQTLRSSD